MVPNFLSVFQVGNLGIVTFSYLLRMYTAEPNDHYCMIYEAANENETPNAAILLSCQLQYFERQVILMNGTMQQPQRSFKIKGTLQKTNPSILSLIKASGTLLHSTDTTSNLKDTNGKDSPHIVVYIQIARSAMAVF